jgi:hypothetical protein
VMVLGLMFIFSFHSLSVSKERQSPNQMLYPVLQSIE